MTNHKYGWKPPLPDQRDFLYSPIYHDLEFTPVSLLPVTLNLRPQMPPVYDQGQLGSCTANSIGAGVQFLQLKQQIQNFMPSRLFIYWTERFDQGDVGHDTGASVRESAKAVANYGVPPEVDWPYNIGLFNQKPTDRAWQDATQTKITSYLSVAQDAVTMKNCLANGYPIHVGFTVYQSFETAQVAQSGIVPMPAPNETILGGHAVVVVGYDDSRGVWFCRNSWGTNWGDGGYFTMPYAYLLNPQLASDFWTLRQVTGPTPPPPAPPSPPSPPAKHKTGQMNVYSDGSVEWVALANPASDNWIADNGPPQAHSH